MVKKTKLWIYILIIIIAVAIAGAIIFGIYATKNISYAAEDNRAVLNVEIPIT